MKKRNRKHLWLPAGSLAFLMIWACDAQYEGDEERLYEEMLVTDGDIEALEEESGVINNKNAEFELELDLVNNAPSEATPSKQEQCVEAEGVVYYLTPPVRGFDIVSVAWADAECNQWFPGTKWFEFHNTKQNWRAPGAIGHKLPEPTNAWIWNNDQQTECFENGSKGLTYRTYSEASLQSGCYAGTCYAEGHTCNAYHGDTSCLQHRPLLCVKKI